MAVKNLSDEQVLRKLAELNSNEVRVVADVLLYLIEAGKRRLYAKCGYSSLFTYCVEALKYCDGTAGRRIAAARCIERFPNLLNLFLQQRITLTTIVLISKILTPANEEEVTASVCDRKQREVESFVAGYLPERTIREGVKALPSFRMAESMREGDSTSLREVGRELALSSQLSAPKSPEQLPSPIPSLRESSGGKSPQPDLNKSDQVHDRNFEVKLKARGSTIRKLQRVQELRGKKESLGDLFEVMLDEYLEKHSPEARIVRRNNRTESKAKKEQLASENNPPSIAGLDNKGKAQPATQTRYIPQRTRDLLYEEYNGRCAYTAPNGTRCTCRRGLQVDHIYPFALGGSNEIENLRLLCPTHNFLMAEVMFGKEKIGSRISSQSKHDHRTSGSS